MPLVDRPAHQYAQRHAFQNHSQAHKFRQRAALETKAVGRRHQVRPRSARQTYYYYYGMMFFHWTKDYLDKKTQQKEVQGEGDFFHGSDDRLDWRPY